MALLEIRNLVIGLPSDADRANAVDDVSFSVESGEVVCLVGESGSGKSMIALSVMGLTPQTVVTRQGEISFDGRHLLSLSPDQWREIRGAGIGMVFQEPMTALNPIMRIGEQIEESLRFHTDLNARARRRRVLELLDAVGLPNPPEIAQTYPFRLSGGQRQRVVIAIALALSPKLLIADEPTTALDVTTQAQILTLIRDLQRQHGMGLLFITHDLGIVRDIADRVVVMQRGAAVEVGDADQILSSPAHPYTRKLIGAVPTLTPSAVPSPASSVLLSVRDLTKTYTLKATFTGKQRVVRAVDKVSFDIERGKTFGLVGESGSGKSTTGKLITRLASADDGEVLVDGVDISKMSTSELRPYRRRVQIVFQDPFGSLNPRRRVVDLIADGPMAHGTPKAEARDQALELLTTVGLSRDMANRLPHEFSGGQRQRIAIARALALKPELVVADEPVSALDVSVQAQIIELFQDLRRRLSLTMLFITHDLRVAAQLCDRIAVMRSGKVVEIGSASQVLTQPQHEYTRALLASVPGRGG